MTTPPAPAPPAPEHGFTGELYQFVQSAVYDADGLWGSTTFDLYFREFPEGVGYALVAGIDDTVDAVLNLRIPPAQIAWLRQRPELALCGDRFFDELSAMTFSGTIWAMPEGTVVFPREPVMRVTAPLGQVALFETLFTQRVGFSSAVATLASRMVDAAAGRPLADLSARHWFSQEAALAAGRSAFIAGFDSTGNIEVSRTLDMDMVSSFGGSFIAAYGDARVAFDALQHHAPAAFHLMLPEEDPRESINRFAHLGSSLRWVRVQHTNLLMASRLVREALDSSGLRHARIFASGVNGATQIHHLVSAGAPIDRFAVGSALLEGIPSLMRALVFRMAERSRGGTPTPAHGPASSYYPGRKQVIRYGSYDLICLHREADYLATPENRVLLQCVVRDGQRLIASRPAGLARQRRTTQLVHLPSAVRDLKAPLPYPIHSSDALASLALG